MCNQIGMTQEEKQQHADDLTILKNELMKVVRKIAKLTKKLAACIDAKDSKKIISIAVKLARKLAYVFALKEEIRKQMQKMIDLAYGEDNRGVIVYEIKF